jgi:cellulose synthase/poly-beta-1,6-N-acetylglucosamine synthase-like glycosyltransferase
MATVTMIVIIAGIVLSILYLSTTIFLFRGLVSLDKEPLPHNLHFSVVIAARNEEKNIETCLAGVLDQTIGAGHYEVILVNDRSADKTAAIARAIAKRHSNLTVLSVTETPPGISPKKYAVLQGIKQAKNEIIVFTDADCRVPATWLETIDRCFKPETGFVQGITSYERVEGGMNAFFFGLQALDFCSHAVVSAAAIGAGLPINSNANNCAFRKKAFDDAAGYGKEEAVVSGDDDMLLQRIWGKTGWHITYMTELAGAVTTLPMPTTSGVFEQRKRWGSKTVHYGLGQVALLSGVFTFYCTIVALLGIGVFFPSVLVPALCLMLVKIAGEAILMVPGTRIMGQKSLRKYLVIGSLVQLPMVIFAVVLGIFGRFKWKDQTFARKAGSGKIPSTNSP